MGPPVCSSVLEVNVEHKRVGDSKVVVVVLVFSSLEIKMNCDLFYCSGRKGAKRNVSYRGVLFRLTLDCSESNLVLEIIVRETDCNSIELKSNIRVDRFD